MHCTRGDHHGARAHVDTWTARAVGTHHVGGHPGDPLAVADPVMRAFAVFPGKGVEFIRFENIFNFLRDVR